MTPLRIVIVDDEPGCVRRLERLIDTTPAAEVVGTARDGLSGLELIRATEPDLVFLDIRMPGMDGVQVAEALASDALPAIIFTTAFADFAVSAFDLGAFDYLLKPVQEERVRAGIERARERLRLQSVEERARNLETALKALRGPEEDVEGAGALRWLWVVDGRGRTRLAVDDVERFEAERDYVRVHVEGRSYLIRATLQSIMGKLDPSRFVRVHRSLVVNLEAVRGLRRRITGAMTVTLQSGAEAPVGRVYLAEFRNRLRLPLPAMD